MVAMSFRAQDARDPSNEHDAQWMPLWVDAVDYWTGLMSVSLVQT
jgi:hypothetical protein